jgi:hypothetical protein
MAPSPSPSSTPFPSHAPSTSRTSVSLGRGMTARSAVHRPSTSRSKIPSINVQSQSPLTNVKKEDLSKLDKKELVAIIERLEVEKLAREEAKEEERKESEKVSDLVVIL